MIDHFSKYVQAYPLPDKKAASVSKCILAWISFLGPPEIVQCDNGREFKRVLKRILRRHGIRIINGRPRHPQSQGCVERTNRTFKRAINKMRLERGKKWAHLILEVVLSLNSQRCSSTPLHGRRHMRWYSSTG